MHPKLITCSDSHVQSVNSVTLLDEIARDGARRMIIEALQLVESLDEDRVLRRIALLVGAIIMAG